MLADIREGFVSPEAAERDYGVVLKREGGDFVVDSRRRRRARASDDVDEDIAGIVGNRLRRCEA